MALSKIHGQMLRQNLVRDIDVGIDTDLFYLDVNNRRIGVNTVLPSSSLSVNGDIAVGDFVVSGNSINSNSSIVLDPATNVVVPYATPNTLAFFGPVSDLSSAAGLAFDGTILESAGGAVFGNVTISGNNILSDGDLNITSLTSGDINISPTGTGVLQVSNLLIQESDANRVLVTNSNGLVTSSNNLIFDGSNLTHNGVFSTGPLVIDQGTLTVSGTMVIDATNIIFDPEDEIQVLSSLPTGVYYSNNNQALTTSSDFTFSNGVLMINDQVDVGNISLFDTTLSVSTNSDFYVQVPGSIVTSSTIANQGVMPGEPLLLTTYNNYNYGLWLSDHGHSIRIAGGNAATDDSALTIIAEIGSYDLPTFPTGDWNRYFSVLSDGTVVIESDLAVGRQSVLGDIVIKDNEIASTTTDLRLFPSGVLRVESSEGLVMPSGPTSARPLAPSQGTTRFNSETLELEMWDGIAWLNTTPRYAAIESQLIAGDGSSTHFTLDRSTRTEDIIVSINGVLQVPVQSYLVTGDEIVFPDPLDSSDLVEIRFISTVTTIESIYTSSIIDGGSF